MNRIKPLFDLTGKVAIVTGASKGIGEAMARGFAEFGAKVVVSSRNQDAVDNVAAGFQESGYEATGIACHVADHEQREKLVEKTVKKYGRIDILVNNAGTNPYFGPVTKMPMEAYQKTMDINVNSALVLSNLCYPYMKEQGGGSIIHISSVEGLHSSAMFTAYNISKAALITLGKNQAVEWGKHNIRVNTICPGFVKTKLSSALVENDELSAGLKKNTALHRIAEPDEMAGLAVLLASGASSFMTGSVIVNDGGLLNTPFF